MGDLIAMDVVRTANELLPRLYTAACGEGVVDGLPGPLAQATKSGMAHVISLTGVEARPSGGPPTCDGSGSAGGFHPGVLASAG